MDDSQETQEIGNSFRKVLNRHGYGFQYAVLNRAAELRSKGSPWYPLVPEFPVEVAGHSTRIDFLLATHNPSRYLVCECKRANPATANWCFARSGWIPSNQFAGFSYAEVLRRADSGRPLTQVRRVGNSDRIYQVAREVRVGTKGDPEGANREEIELAATQVCRGLNGLISLLSSREELLENRQEVALFPAIFTTARLFTIQTELTSAELTTGEIPAMGSEAAEVDWIWYDYPQSPGLKHSVVLQGLRAELNEVLYQEFVRRIAIVGVRGVDSFLTSPLWTVPYF